MTLSLLPWVLALWCAGAQPATLDRVIDGDTYVLTIELGYDTLTRATIRLADLDTYERFTPQGKAATLDANGVLRSGAITVRATGDRTFARYVAHVYVDGVSLADWLRVHEKPRAP